MHAWAQAIRECSFHFEGGSNPFAFEESIAVIVPKLPLEGAMS